MSHWALPVTYAEVEAAAQRLAGVAHQTPVMTSRTVNLRTGCEVFFKCENLQRIGAFKFRGAYNALVQLDPDQRQRGVLTFSSGNHAQAMALSGQLLGIPVTVVMPSDAPQAKRTATEGYGAKVIAYDRALVLREVLTAEIAAEYGLVVIPPYDHKDVIAGQGTTARELMQCVDQLDVLLVCCGGGGLLAGCAIATKTLQPTCQVIGVEPATADDATRSFYSGSLQTVTHPQTIADGARTPHLGQLTFPLILHYVDGMVTVADEAIVRAMRLLWERMKLVVEPTGALATAALLEGLGIHPGQRVGVILSGGNIDLGHVSELFKRYDPVD